VVLLYYLAFPGECRRAVFDSEVDEALKNVCLKIECRHEEKPLGIGADKKDAHFLVRSVLTYSVTKLMRMNQEFSNGGGV